MARTGLPPDCQPRRILLVRLSHLGDASQAVAVVHALQTRFPTAGLYWAMQSEFAGLLDCLPQLAGRILFNRRGGFRAWPRLRRELQPHGFDLAVDAQGNWKSAMVTRLSGAPVRLGLHTRDWREPSAAWVTNWRATPATGPHAMQRMQALVEAIQPGAPLQPHIPIDPAHLDTARRQLAQWQTSGAAPLRRILHLSVPGDDRSLPPELCRELVQSWSAAGEGTLVLSGPAEAELGRQFEQQFQADPAVRHWVGQRGVPQLCALFAAAAEAGLVLVASDSGPCHLATACDLPTRILFGRTRPERNGPWPLPGPGSPHRTLLAPGGDLRRLAADEVHAWIAQDARP